MSLRTFASSSLSSRLARSLRVMRVFALVGSSASCVANLGEPSGDGASGGAFSGSGGFAASSGGAPAAGGAVASGGAASTGGVSGVISYATAAEVIDSSCGLSVCHGAHQEPIIQNDALLPDLLRNTFVEACGNAPLVTPGDPSRSALLMLVERQCIDLVMPDECRRDPCLPANDIAILRAWIEQGAPFQ